MTTKKTFIPSNTEQGRRMTGAKLGNSSGHIPHYGEKQAKKDRKRAEKLKEKANYDNRLLSTDKYN